VAALRLAGGAAAGAGGGVSGTGIRDAAVALPCADLGATVDFFLARLGFRVESIWPADDPEVAVLSGHGLRVRLERGAAHPPGTLVLRAEEPRDALVAPNGTRVEFRPAAAPMEVPALRPRFLVTRAADAAWHAGRAGMAYRDLIPDRLGGRFIASQILIEAGGTVSDYVHFHVVRFQMIYCRAGWVRVVYEDQGEPFTMRAGDCVLQPPRIRHRVLEASPGLEVIEIGCPARHETVADHALALPTDAHRADREFDGQCFVRHVAADAAWAPWRHPGFECRDTGIGAATAGLAGARVVRPRGADATPAATHDREFAFGFVLAGTAMLDAEGSHRLAAGDGFVVPAGMPHALLECAPALELLEVTLPA
jgi:mannose-6-phosphate isomerase-like protein (cupin superfamily)